MINKKPKNYKRLIVLAELQFLTNPYTKILGVSIILSNIYMYMSIGVNVFLRVSGLW